MLSTLLKRKAGEVLLNPPPSERNAHPPVVQAPLREQLHGPVRGSRKRRGRKPILDKCKKCQIDKRKVIPTEILIKCSASTQQTVINVFDVGNSALSVSQGT